MGLTYGIIALDESAIRTIVREAEIGMADGEDPKALLVAAAQDYIASENAAKIAAKFKEAVDLADMMGDTVDMRSAEFLADVREDFEKQNIANRFEDIVFQHSEEPDAMCYALAKAIITAKPVLPMHRGKFLSKIGIVASHIAALGSGSTASSPAAPEPEDDGGLADMLGLSEEPPAPLDQGGYGEFPSLGGYADIAVAQAPAPAVAPIAEASSLNAVEGPPTSADPRGAMILFGQAASYEDADLAKRLGVSRSTVHNYLSGKTVKVKLTLAQARVMLGEIDLRLAKLADAAKLLSAIRE